jgi:hypothetical protein
MNRFTTTAAVMLAAALAGAASEGQGASLTYLNHFNNAGNFDADLGGAPTATVTGAPASTAGFLNGGVELSRGLDQLLYAAVGNVGSTDGVSMGFWVKSAGYDSITEGAVSLSFAGIERADFPPGRDSLTAEWSTASSFYSAARGNDVDGAAFFTQNSTAWHHVYPGLGWVYYNVDIKLPQAGPNSGHYRLRVYDSSGNILAGVGGDVSGLLPLSPGQQDAFGVFSDMSIRLGTPFGAGEATLVYDELAIWNGSLTEAEIDLIVAGMAAGNELPEPASATLLLALCGGWMMRRRAPGSGA